MNHGKCTGATVCSFHLFWLTAWSILAALQLLGVSSPFYVFLAERQKVRLETAGYEVINIWLCVWHNRQERFGDWFLSVDCRWLGGRTPAWHVRVPECHPYLEEEGERIKDR